MTMGDQPEIRVFDSVSAAVENSAQPAPPPYAPETAAEEVPVPPVRKAPAKKPAAKPAAAVAHAGSAGTTTKAHGTK